MASSGHGVEVVVTNDEKVGGRGRVCQLALQPTQLGMLVLSILLASILAVLARDERGGVEENGDEVICEALGKVGCRHVPSRVARGELDLGGNVADVVVIA